MNCIDVMSNVASRDLFECHIPVCQMGKMWVQTGKKSLQSTPL